MPSTGQLIAVFNSLTLAVIIGGLIYLVILAALVHDLEFITKHPVWFVIETAAMFALPGLPILLFMISQDVKPSAAMKFFLGVGVKFAIFHVLLHLSGIYRVMFEVDYPIREHN